MDLKTIQYQVKDNVALITLSRPQQYNAVNSVMSQELPKVWHKFDNDSDAVVAIITGSGEKSFCTGADLADLPTMDDEHGKASLDSIKWTSLQNDIWKPVICAVNGMTCGGGLHFIADSDIILCSSNSTFFDTHVKVGLVAGLEPVGLSRKVPLESVLRMSLVGGNERMNAEKALAIGLVGEVVDQGLLMDRAFEIADMIKGNSPSALEKTKKAIWNSKEMGMSEALNRAWDLISEQNLHPDFEEGGKAFIEKRKPNWKSVK
ncbi:MAG: enoyl-CoA hydratase-related protein [SAR86 cluster bacterium]|nr:enoyl-CoA hydratase-related protein [SAR86 cluster bacterium]|tara:strand:+ start:4695 stop:5480 length:786 start_codon:yes stop_codon:yes gene_type:complete